MTRVAGELFVSHWEPELGPDVPGYLSGSVRLGSPPVWVHVSARTDGRGPRITHAGFDGRLERAMVDLEPSPGKAGATLRTEVQGDAMQAPARVAGIATAYDRPAGLRKARRLTLTWPTENAATADDAELLATNVVAQRVVKELLTWTCGGPPRGTGLTADAVVTAIVDVWRASRVEDCPTEERIAEHLGTTDRNLRRIVSWEDATQRARDIVSG